MIGLQAKAVLSYLGLAALWATVSGTAAEPEPQASGVVPAKVWRYAERWLARSDADGDGKLTTKEWPPSAGSPGAVDANQDGQVTVDELARHIADFGRHRKIRLMPSSVGGLVPLPSLLPPGMAGANESAAPGEEGRSPSPDDEPAETTDEATSDSQKRPGDRKYFVSPSRLPPGLPDWFLKRDADGDGQLTLAEYSESGSASADKEFAGYDRNRDGLITPREVVGGSSQPNRTKRPPATAPATPPTPATDTTTPPPAATEPAPKSPAAESAPQPPTAETTPQSPATESAPQPETPASEKRYRKKKSSD